MTPRAGASLTVSSPLQVMGVDKAPPRHPPALGEHSAEILAELGYDQAAVAHLVAPGVVVQARADR